MKPLKLAMLPKMIEVPRNFVDFYACQVCQKPIALIALTVMRYEVEGNEGHVHVQLKTSDYQEPWLCPDCSEPEGEVN